MGAIENLSINWRPDFGDIYTWFAIDKNGSIAMLINNCWGDIPKSILSLKNVNKLISDINDYIWEESNIYSDYPKNKNGGFILDMYCCWLHKPYNNKQECYEDIMNEYIREDDKVYTDANIAMNKDFFIYEAVEGTFPGEDYPVGYDGETEMGDYFRYLQPTIYGSIEDFPKELRGVIAVSETLDFTKDRLLDNDLINVYFPKVYAN